MKHFCLTFLFFCVKTFLIAQTEVKIISDRVELYGSLLVPANKSNKAILIIAGSGATDRDGNTKPIYVNNGLKILSEELKNLGYSCLTYDKRGVGKSVSDALKPEELRFEQLVDDAASWITYLKKDYTDITIIGHSQGALIGMMAIQKNKVQRFISLAGLSEDAYTTIKRQLSGQPPYVKDAAYPKLDSLKNGLRVKDIPPYLNSLMNQKIQDYFISFMKYDPRAEIKKVKCPILIIQGTTDLQITVSGATEMSMNADLATLKIIEEMNHVLRKSSSDIKENMSTYNNATLPLHHDLVSTIRLFLEGN